MQFPTLPAHQKWGKGSTLAAQGMLGGTDTMVSRVGFFVIMGQKLGKVPIKSHFQGMDGTYYAIKLLQHGPTNPLSPQPPGWEGMTKVKNGVQAQGLGPWGIK